MAPATRCFANWLLSQFGSADRDGPWSLRVRTTVLTRQFGGPHDKCFPNNLLGRRQRKFPTRHRSPPLAPRFNGRRSAVGTFLSVLPWRPRPTARPRAPPGWMRERFFRKAAGMSPISCLVGMALHSWWHRDAIAAAHSQRGRHDHRAGQLQHLFATSQIVYGPVWSALLMAAPLPSRCLMAKPPIRCAYRIGRQAQTVPPSRYSL
jgi:hypothetical protein